MISNLNTSKFSQHLVARKSKARCFHHFATKNLCTLVIIFSHNHSHRKFGSSGGQSCRSISGYRRRFQSLTPRHIGHKIIFVQGCFSSLVDAVQHVVNFIPASRQSNHDTSGHHPRVKNLAFLATSSTIPAHAKRSRPPDIVAVAGFLSDPVFPTSTAKIERKSAICMPGQLCCIRSVCPCCGTVRYRLIRPSCHGDPAVARVSRRHMPARCSIHNAIKAKQTCWACVCVCGRTRTSTALLMLKL